MYTADNKELADFIRDFKLLPPDELICFDAKIIYSSNNVIKKFTSNVNIVLNNGKGSDVIYLFDKEIQALGLKEMFDVEEERIGYIKNNCLLLKGETATGKYHVGIYPLNADCDEEKMTTTLLEYINSHF